MTEVSMKLMRSLHRDERGQALPIALMLLTLGVFYVIPTVLSTVTNLVNQRVAKVHLVDEYSAEAGLTRAMWQLLNCVSNCPVTLTSTTTVNGTTVNVNVANGPGNLVARNEANIVIDSDIHLTPQDELWLVLIHKAPWVKLSVYYDAFAFPSHAIVPWQSGARTYYFSNTAGSPLVEDPSGDAVESLITTETRPTSQPASLDYDGDGMPGRTVDSKNSNASQECAHQVLANQGANLDPTARVVWRMVHTNPVGNPIPGTIPAGSTVTARFWWTLDWWQGGGASPPSELRAYLCVYQSNVNGGEIQNNNPFNPCDLGGSCPAGHIQSEGVTDQFPWSSAYTITATAGGRTVTAGVDRIDTSNVETFSWQVQ